MSNNFEYWDEKCRAYIGLELSPDRNSAHSFKKKIIGEVCSSLPNNNSAELITWFESCLLDESRKWFVIEVFNEKKPLPEKLFIPFVRAAIYEKSISLNRHILRPCVQTFGELEVNKILNDYLVNGNEKERVSAEELLYWVDKFR